jgi:hypothetical protein
MTDRMDKPEKTRKLILGGTLTATLILVVLAEDEGEIHPIQSVQSMQTTESNIETALSSKNDSEYLDVDQLGKRKFSAQSGELFNSTSWVVKRALKNSKRQETILQQTIERAVAKKAATTPPPLQFKYLGKVVERDQTKIILSLSDEKIVVNLGERIDDRYRFDAIDNETITLTYLPLNIEQTLIINNPGDMQ